jgi:hypothetical protein
MSSGRAAVAETAKTAPSGLHRLHEHRCPKGRAEAQLRGRRLAIRVKGSTDRMRSMRIPCMCGCGATDGRRHERQATAHLYTRPSAWCIFRRVRRLVGEVAMASFNVGTRACQVRRADEDLRYEVGTVHDYFWHRRHRARRGGQLVDVAILVAFATVASYIKGGQAWGMWGGDDLAALSTNGGRSRPQDASRIRSQQGRVAAGSVRMTRA